MEPNLTLHALSGPLKGRTITIDVGHRLLLGRSSSADLRIKDAGISRRHCVVEWSNSAPVVRDLGSVNGTFVNGHVVSSAFLNRGDRLVLGESVFAVEGSVFLELNSPGIEVPGYHIRRPLGKGGMGEVYLGEHEVLGRPVALKILRPKRELSEADRKRFMREGRAAARLDHKNIVQVYDVLRIEASLVIVMAYAGGGSVIERIRERGTLSPDATLAIAFPLVRALAYLEKAGVVHRDLKPHNVFFDEGGVVKLGDFGLAKVAAESGTSGITEAGTSVGTLPYIAPEQLEDALQANHKSDMYSFGATLYHCLTGRPPFRGGGLRDVMRQILREPPPPIANFQSGVPDTLEAIILHCLAKHPDDRFQDYETLEDALKSVRNG